MRVFKLLAITLLFINWIQASAQQQQDSITLQAKLKKDEIFRVRYPNDLWAETVVQFRNTSGKDTVITKKVSTSHITEFRYSLSVQKSDGKFESFLHNFFLMPNTKTTLSMQENMDLSVKDVHYTQNLFKLFNNDYQVIKALNKGNLDEYNRNAKSTWEENKSRLRDLWAEAKIHSSEIKVYESLLQIDYWNRLLAPVSSYGLVTDSSTLLIKENLKQIHEQGPKLINTYNAFGLQSLYIDLIRTELALKNKKYDGLVDFIQTVSEYKIPALKVAGLMFGRIHYEEKRGTEEFLAALSIIEKFCKENNVKEYDAFINEIYPSIDKQNEIMLVNAKGVKTSFSQVLKNNKGKIFIIDLWASWCVPCRQEMPYFIKTKEKLKDKNIVFLSISLDEDDKKPQWITALTKEKLLTASNQFKLITPKKSSLSRSLRIESIPRYVLINDEGKVLNSSFVKPSDPLFESELLRAAK